MDLRSHAAVRELLPSYAAGQLTPSERTTIEQHVATCADCRAELGEWRRLGEWLAQADAAIPPDTGASRGLTAIHARLRQNPAHSLNGFNGVDGVDSFERSALPTMTDQDFPHISTGQSETPTLPPARERRPSTTSSGGATARQYQPPRLHSSSIAAGASALVFLALVASLFYVLAPRLRPHQTALTPTATATIHLTPTPQPRSGSWHTASDAPTTASGVQFAKSAPQTGYLCDSVDVGSGSAPTSSSQWLYKTSDGGMTWRPVGGITPPSQASMFCYVFIDANDSNDVFVQLVCQSAGPATCESLWRSRDGGVTWRQLSMPQLPWGWDNIAVVGSRIVALATDARPWGSPNGVVCSTDPNTTDPHQINDLYASDDGGKSWKQIGQPLINQGLSILPGGESGFGSNPSGAPDLLSAGTALFVRTFCLAGHNANGDWNFQQTYWKSGDGGKTWTKLPTPDSDMYLTPSATGGAYGVAFDPRPNVLTAAPAVLYSRDGGVTWNALPSVDGIPLPPEFPVNPPGCKTTCPTRYSTPWAIALPDGSVLVEVYVHNANSNSTLDALFALDPQSPQPAWREFALMSVGSAGIVWSTGWPLAATSQGLVLWALPNEGLTPLARIYLSPLP